MRAITWDRATACHAPTAGAIEAEIPRFWWGNAQAVWDRRTAVTRRLPFRIRFVCR